eukprot:TRINITY_DN8842_c0_g1_i3.p1 TRINITY_DN8842_c0_g1~~TRINITY_DN8842_c0_g1_i3.p1  ORF type:complete len:479 (+),score=65.64 TRINITY_DN8842_c0_g1_i3:49-1437(+)
MAASRTFRRRAREAASADPFEDLLQKEQRKRELDSAYGRLRVTRARRGTVRCSAVDSSDGESRAWWLPGEWTAEVVAAAGASQPGRRQRTRRPQGLKALQAELRALRRLVACGSPRAGGRRTLSTTGQAPTPAPPTAAAQTTVRATQGGDNSPDRAPPLPALQTPPKVRPAGDTESPGSSRRPPPTLPGEACVGAGDHVVMYYSETGSREPAVVLGRACGRVRVALLGVVDRGQLRQIELDADDLSGLRDRWPSPAPANEVDGISHCTRPIGEPPREADRTTGCGSMSRLSADRGGPCDIEVYEYTDVVPWYKRRIFLMYEHYSRGRLSSLPAIFSDNAAHLDQVLRILVQKYGPEPGRDPPPLIDYHGRLSCIAADYPIGDTPALLREWCGREELLILNIRWQHHFQEITVAPFVVADADTWGRLRRIYWRWRPDFVAAEDAWQVWPLPQSAAGGVPREVR